MKITRSPQFTPITIELESLSEARTVLSILIVGLHYLSKGDCSMSAQTFSERIKTVEALIATLQNYGIKEL